MNKIIYLDAAASFLKPESVIKRQSDFLNNEYANAGRGVCERAVAVDNMVAYARQSVADFIGANFEQIVFTSGATDGFNRIVNIIKNTLSNIETVLVSALDHHSARMPWMALARCGKCKIAEIPLDCEYNIDINQIPNADIIVITAMSNVMGVPQDVAKIIEMARKKNPNIISIVDAAQYVVHSVIDAKKWGADFICFSGHKIGADTGVGIMYIRQPDRWNSDKFGGGMVNKITGEMDWIENVSPDKFEAGTLPLTQISGLPIAIDCIKSNRPDLGLIQHAHDLLQKNPRIQILTSRNAAILSFVIDGMHVLDFGTLVGAYGVCMRVGNMCATWVHNKLGIPSSARISVGNWNTIADIENAVNIINRVVK
ncbi:MAG: aminotransferase class V-fold PLP-dependent enzyme [Alphaproteobacteria bacterium]|nr:aminotransferase class V-fold PLP-dependent enzyme [Alphaproteobacteria bacterium]